MWVVDDGTLAADAEETLAQGASTAALLLLRARAARELARHRSGDLLRRVLDGTADPATSAARLGVEGPVRVAAFALDEAGLPDAEQTGLRLLEVVRLRCEARYGRQACVLLDGVVYALLPAPGARHRRLAEEIVARAGQALRVPVRAGLGEVVAGLGEATASRADADLVLRVLGPSLPVATVDEVRPRVTLLRLTEVLTERRELTEGSWRRVLAYDGEHGTDHARTLVCWFDAGCDIAAAARLLAVHPNTCRYRLKQVQPARRNRPGRPRRTAGAVAAVEGAGGARSGGRLTRGAAVPAGAAAEDGACAQRSASATSRAASTTRGPTRSGTASASITTPTLPSTPVTPSRGAAAPLAAGLQLSVRQHVTRLPESLLPGRENRPARGAPVQRMPEPGPIGHVIVRPRGLHDGHGQRLGAVHQREMSRRPDVLGERPQRGQRGLPHQRMHLSSEAQHAQSHPGPPAEITPYEGVLLQCGEQPVHHGPVHAQFVGQLGDGEPVVRVGQKFEDTQSPVKRLRGLRGHDAHSSKW